MMQTHYLIVGASHAALSAVHAIRNADAEHDVTVVSKDDSLPYSPTILPYVVSGRSDPDSIFLKDAAYFARERVQYLRGVRVTGVDARRSVATLSDGGQVEYAKMLVASGATPAVPAIPGLEHIAYHVLRTLQDALDLREMLATTRAAIVLGAGLVGMHAAENLRKAGAAVSVVEMRQQVLPGYFDAEAAEIIRGAFVKAGVSVITGERAMRISPRDVGFDLELSGKRRLRGDLLIVGTGVIPVTDFLRGTGVACERGVLVDDAMRTSVPNIWAAGDVAQARDFYSDAKLLSGVLPDAVEQGKIAGMSMADDLALEPYSGGVPLNTYNFFGQTAISVGVQDVPQGARVVKRIDPAAGTYLKIVLGDDRLLGIFGINELFDAGVMWELILRKVDLGPVRQRFLSEPQTTARMLMSKLWR